MKKIIVFTKASSLNTGFDNFAKNRADIQVLDEDSQKIILFSESENIFKPEKDFSKTGLYFVYDLINETDFNSIIKGITKSDFYILKHSEPKFVLKDFTNVVKGITEKRDKKGVFYPDLVDILKDSNESKVKRIFEKIFTFDSSEEELTEAIFQAIYNKNDDDVIEKAVVRRDKYLFKKITQIKL